MNKIKLFRKWIIFCALLLCFCIFYVYKSFNCVICIKHLKLMFFNLEIQTNLTLVLIVLWTLVIPEHFSYLKFFKDLLVNF
ncbi:hypothetical protein MBOVa_3860 [Mycoplasmopsis bovis 8790]|nr:hypothetical protein MBOVa_3860 [Mycoplasmopsis bovis 8790]